MAKLRLNLYKFPNYIGHASSRISRFQNEDNYSMAMLKLMSRGNEYQIDCLSKASDTGGNTVGKPSDKDKHIFTKPVLNLNIFDGHGGKDTSGWLSENLAKELARTIPNKETFFKILKQYTVQFPDSYYWKHVYEKRENYYTRFIVNCSTKKEQVLYNGSRMIFDKHGNIIDKTSLLSELDRLRIFQTFLGTDLQNCENGLPGGSTASSILLSPYNEDETLPTETRDTFFVSSDHLMKLCVVQVGDCKVLLCDKNGIAHSLTMVHHPNTTQESKRLSHKDPKTSRTENNRNADTLEDDDQVGTDSFGEKRFLNVYANTRSFGDVQGKPMGLSCEPDIYSYLIGSTRNLPHQEKAKLQFGGDECFVCLVSDGVTNVMSDQEIVDLITSTVNNRGLKKATTQFVCDEVIKYLLAVSGKNADNATCLILRLSNWGNWPVLDRTGAMREEKLMNQDELRE
ncbi:hypothetical protein ACO0QE_000828 [Hanseniaspora vineae]